MKPLTASQAILINYLWAFFNDNDQIPPCQTIARDFGWSSPNAAQEKLESLCGRGLLAKNRIGKWKFTPQAKSELAKGPWAIPERPVAIIQKALKQLQPKSELTANNPFSLEAA